MDDNIFFDENEDMQQEEDQGQFEDDYQEDEYEDGHSSEETDLNQLLDFLTKSLTEARPIPLMNARAVNVEMCLSIVENIRLCLPDAVRYGQQIIDNRDRILRDAESEARLKIQSANSRADSALEDATHRAQTTVNEAENHANEIVEEARRRARAMIDNSEIMQHAHEEATQLCNEARAQANEQKMEAVQYTEQLLRELERDVQATLDAVRRSIKNITG